MTKALLTFSIGPVHTFIAQARRIADVWAGSNLLSDLIREAIKALREAGGEMVYPFIAATELPEGLPNRFVCRVPLNAAEESAEAMERAVRGRWSHLVVKAKEQLSKYGIDVRDEFDAQADELLEIAWSFVPEQPDYATASVEGARQFDASRLCRPFAKFEQGGTHCAVCGQRTALPDGISTNIGDAWKRAEEKSKDKPDAGYFRFDQGRLCLVCATKRLYPIAAGQRKAAQFASFEAFEPPRDDEKESRTPYFALVALDGDRMGKILRRDHVPPEGAEPFHRRVSEILTAFAKSLRTDDSPALNLAAIGYQLPNERKQTPQLIYAGGEDVLFVCDPRDAIPIADAIRRTYIQAFASESEVFTISAAIIFAHTKEPAGALLRDVQTLLKEKAKREKKRDALAIRLMKRGGPPTDVAFKWDGEAARPIDRIANVVKELAAQQLGSTQLFALADDARRLGPIDFGHDQWVQWLEMRLGRGGKSAAAASPLAAALSPFFEQDQVDSLRIARFLGTEMER